MRKNLLCTSKKIKTGNKLWKLSFIGLFFHVKFNAFSNWAEVVNILFFPMYSDVFVAQ